MVSASCSSNAVSVLGEVSGTSLISGGAANQSGISASGSGVIRESASGDLESIPVSWGSDVSLSQSGMAMSSIDSSVVKSGAASDVSISVGIDSRSPAIQSTSSAASLANNGGVSVSVAMGSPVSQSGSEYSSAVSSGVTLRSANHSGTSVASSILEEGVSCPDAAAVLRAANQSASEVAAVSSATGCVSSEAGTVSRDGSQSSGSVVNESGGSTEMVGAVVVMSGWLSQSGISAESSLPAAN